MTGPGPRVGVFLVTVGVILAMAGMAAAQAENGDAGGQVLTQGPVHEAFAETVTFNPTPGIVVAKAPPAAIEEMPPDQRPEGTNVAWIPGYWGWDEQRNDFLWISGIWRDLPPGRQWVPGYWGQTAQGYQWISGYWADTQVTEVNFLQEPPPQSVEAGPNVAAPSPNDIWLPGCWMWNQTRYVWRPGFWAAAQPNWVWVPAHYIWTPRGYVFVDGYYDYVVAQRGVLFAPVYFAPQVYVRPGFVFAPAAVISLGLFTDHLFLCPRYSHYYFGDYYAVSYRQAGFYPWFSYASGHHGYDPFYAHMRWEHRADRDWDRRVEAEFMRRREHEDLRPPRTWAAQQALVNKAGARPDRSLVVATSFTQLTKSKDTTLRFQTLDKAERTKIAKNEQEVQRFRGEREKLEVKPAGVVTAPGKQPGPVAVKLPSSPISAGLLARPDGAGPGPKAIDMPRPNAKIEPKPGSKLEVGKPDAKVEPKTMPKPVGPGVIKPDLPGPGSKPSAKIERPMPKTEGPQPKFERPNIEPKVERPQPKVERPNPEPRAKPKSKGEGPNVKGDRPEYRVQRPVEPPSTPQPKVERVVPQPKVERPTPQPKVERFVPTPQPKVERPAPQPRVERPAPTPPPRTERAPAPGPGPKEKKDKDR